MTVTTPSDPAPIVALEDTASAIASVRRAALADRYAANALNVEWRKLADLDSIHVQWRELADCAIESNVFYDPAFARHAADVFGRDVGAFLVWSATRPRRLLGFFPGRIETRRYGVRLPVFVGWTHPYAPLGCPLVAAETAEPVIGAFLAYLADNERLPGVLLLPYLPAQGAFAAKLDVIVRRAQMPVTEFKRHSRAQLDLTGQRTHDAATMFKGQRFKDLRRLGRRLAERGATLLMTKTEPADIAIGLEDFLALEERGWKGKAGTAIALDDDIRQWVTGAVGALAAESKVVIDSLYLDGRAIAVTLTLCSGDTGWLWKTTYDEEFGRFAPGVLLTAGLTEQRVDDALMTRIDSCATADHTMINRIWPERLALSDRMIVVRPGASLAYVQRLEMLRNAAIGAARRLRDWTRAK